MSVKDLCQEIEQRRQQALERKASPYPRNQPVASDLGPCDRELVYQITNWKDRPAFTPYIMARLERGSEIESIIIRELGALGIHVRVERSPFEIKGRNGQVILRGKVDGFIEWKDPNTDKKPDVYPFEAKSMNPNVFQGINGIGDLKGFFAKWPRQVQAYLFGNNMEEGFMLIDDCMGHWKLLPVSLDYQEVEKIVQRCEQTVNIAKSLEAHDFSRPKDPIGTPLPAYHTDPSVCIRCWCFGRVCFPPLTHEGMDELSPEKADELIPVLDRRNEIEELKTEWGRLDKQAKSMLKGLKQAVVGNYLVQGKEIERKGYKVEDSKYWKTDITVIKEG